MTLCNDHMETTIMILASGGLGLSVAAICSIIVLVLLAKRGDETNDETSDQTSYPAKETRFTIPDFDAPRRGIQELEDCAPLVS